MELHQLRYFVTVAQVGNFTRAAEKCQVAQPSLSQQVIKLERELGQPLLERLGRKVRLTDAGRTLYDQAVTILAAVDDARRQVQEGVESGLGRVSIGAIPTIAPYVIPPLLKQFVQRFPQAEVSIHEDLTRHTVKGCLDGDLDVGLVALPIEEQQLSVEPLFSEELLLATAADHRLAKKKRVTMKDVSSEPFILLSETHCLGEQIVSFCTQQECQPAVSCRSVQLFTVQELVGLGHGVSLIPAMACAGDTSRRRQYRSLSGARPSRTIAMIWHKQRYQSPIVQQLIQLLRESGKEKK